MSTEIYNSWSIALAAISLLVTALGLGGAYIQIKKLQESAWSNMHSKLCDQSFELLKFLSETPGTYDYFYNKKPLQPDEPGHAMVLYQAEALANFLEHLILQQDQLPEKQWEVWQRFISGTFDASVVVCQFITEHSDWYSPDLVGIARKCQ
jgi:hypothetical protein